MKSNSQKSDNQFAHLSAENPMHELARVKLGETFTATAAALNARPTCIIVEADIGDDDCRKTSVRVENEAGDILCFGFADKIDAAFWATESGYQIKDRVTRYE